MKVYRGERQFEQDSRWQMEPLQCLRVGIEWGGGKLEGPRQSRSNRGQSGVLPRPRDGEEQQAAHGAAGRLFRVNWCQAARRCWYAGTPGVRSLCCGVVRRSSTSSQLPGMHCCACTPATISLPPPPPLFNSPPSLTNTHARTHAPKHACTTAGTQRRRSARCGKRNPGRRQFRRRGGGGGSPAIWAPSPGCRPTIWTAGLRPLRKRDTPMMVPVVPMLLTKCVTRPAVCSQISGPVPHGSLSGSARQIECTGQAAKSKARGSQTENPNYIRREGRGSGLWKARRNSAAQLWISLARAHLPAKSR